MRTVTDISEDSVWAAVWLHPDTDKSADNIPRHDSVRASIHRATGHAKIQCLIDIGLPILQLQLIEFDPNTSHRGEILSLLADDQLAVAFGEALTLSTIARQTDLPISDGQAETDDGLELSADLLDIDDFINSGLTTFGIAEKPKKDHLVISKEAARAGIEAGFLTEVGNQLHLAASSGFSGAVNDSAFLAAELMVAEESEYGISLPEGFNDVDLENARLALVAIATPSAATVFHYGDRSAKHHEQHLQAACAYPLFAEMLVINPQLLEIIDNSRPLASAISESTELSRGHLKRIKKLRSPLPFERLFEFGEVAQGTDPLGIERTRRYSIGGELSLDQLIDLFRSFPADWVPANEDEWSAFIDVASACGLPINSGFGIPLEQVLSASRGKWSEFKSSLARAYGMEFKDFDRRQMVLATADAFEMVDDFRNSVIFPLLLGTVLELGNPLPAPSPDLFALGRSIAFHMLTGKAKNIPGSLLSTARHWTARIPALMAAETADEEGDTGVSEFHSDGQSWPKLAANFVAENGLVVQNLTTKDQLRDESARLSHCVGRLYLRKARRGDCHIFSIRSADLSKSYSTIELSPVEGNVVEQAILSQLHIVQHKASNNRRPRKKAIVACQEWLFALRSGKHPADLDATANWRQHQRENRHLEEQDSSYSRAAIEFKWKAVLGRNWNHTDVGRAVWEEWKSYILRGELSRARHRGFLYTKPQIQEFLNSLCPASALALSEASRS